MTLETLKEQVDAVVKTLSASDDDKALNIGLDNSMITAALKCSPTLEGVYPAWCKYLVGYGMMAENGPLTVANSDLTNLATVVSERIEGIVNQRQAEHDYRVMDARHAVIEERRRTYIESLGDKITFVDWADWLAEDPFTNVYCPEWTPDDATNDELSGVSGTSFTEDVANDEEELTEEERQEIRDQWYALGNVNDDEISVEDPVYVDFEDGFENGYVIEDVGAVRLEFLQGAIINEVFKDRSHDEALAQIHTVLVGLPGYSDGEASERGKRHASALRKVVSIAMPKILSNAAPDVTSIRDYRFTGNDDPVIAELRKRFSCLMEFAYVSDTRINFTTSIQIEDVTVDTVETISVLTI